MSYLLPPPQQSSQRRYQCHHTFEELVPAPRGARYSDIMCFTVLLYLTSVYVTVLPQTLMRCYYITPSIDVIFNLFLLYLTSAYVTVLPQTSRRYYYITPSIDVIFQFIPALPDLWICYCTSSDLEEVLLCHTLPSIDVIFQFTAGHPEVEISRPAVYIIILL